MSNNNYLNRLLSSNIEEDSNERIITNDNVETIIEDIFEKQV